MRTLADGGLGAIEVAGPGIDAAAAAAGAAGPTGSASSPIAGSDFHAADRPGRWVGSITTPAAPTSNGFATRSPSSGAVKSAGIPGHRKSVGALRVHAPCRTTVMAIKDSLERFKKGLSKTAQLFNVRSWFGRKVDQSFLDDLEARLIQADVGVAATGRIIDRVREAFGDKTAGEDLLDVRQGRAQGPAGRPAARDPGVAPTGRRST